MYIIITTTKYSYTIGQYVQQCDKQQNQAELKQYRLIPWAWGYFTLVVFKTLDVE